MTTETQDLTSEVFSGTAGQYVRRCMTAWFGHWWWLLAVPVAVCVALALVVSSVWLFVAMMFLFLLVPAVIAGVYYNYAFSPEALTTLYDKRVRLCPDGGLDVILVDKGKTMHFAPADIVSVEDTGKHLVVNVRRPRFHHIAIPLDAIPQDRLTVFVSRLMTPNEPLAR